MLVSVGEVGASGGVGARLRVVDLVEIGELVQVVRVRLF